jgi:hypothetical protein
MSIRHPISETQVADVARSSAMSEEYISVTEALKLVSPFSGNKRDVLTIISNVDTAFRVIAYILTKRIGCISSF